MTDSNTGALSESEIYALLAHERRRLIVHCLEDCLQDLSSPQTIIDLTNCISKHEQEVPSAEHLQHIYLSLYHQHLPKLEDAGAISYDWEYGSVSKGPNFGVLLGTLDDSSNI